MSLGNWELDIKRFVEKANGNLNLVVRKISLDLFTRCIEKSPVDTGRFKSNWQVAIGTIPEGTLQRNESTAKSNGTASFEWDKSGAPSIMRVNSEVLGMNAGDIIYLVNNLPYARRLEYGWSKQAPTGMVRLTVAEYGAVVTKAADEVPK